MYSRRNINVITDSGINCRLSIRINTDFYIRRLDNRNKFCCKIFQSTNCFILDKLIRTREATPGMIYRFEGKPKFVYQLLDINYKYEYISKKKNS